MVRDSASYGKKSYFTEAGHEIVDVCFPNHRKTYGVKISNQVADTLLNISFSGWSADGGGWTCSADGTAYMALSSTSDTPFSLRLYTLTNAMATLRFDGALFDPVGMAFTWISQPGANYTIEQATNLVNDPVFVPCASNIPAAADIRTGWTASPPFGATVFYRVVETDR